MHEPPDFTIETDDAGRARLVLRGVLRVSTVGGLDAALRVRGVVPADLASVDLAGVHEIDTVGAWVVWRVANGAAVTGASEEASRLIAAVSASPTDCDISPKRLPLMIRVPERMGLMMFDARAGSLNTLGSMGTLLVAWGAMLRHPSRLRGKALICQLEQVGVDSLAIIGLMSFLVGIVIAQQGAAQLQQFGAEIYTINLTGRLAMRELGVLMTAIMVAGRSGSAFAAQLGTMKLTEEIDAMRTIGVSPVEALVLPRVLATVLMMPLLGFYASVISIIGGAAIAQVMLDIPFYTFISRIKEVVPLHDVWVGLVKGPVFGLIIALTGCYQGMQVSGNSEEVGQRTTAAVVQAIFVVIVLDAFFAVFFTQVGWG